MHLQTKTLFFLCRKKKAHPAFTLVELLVSISIFSVVMVITASLFVSGFRLNQQVSVREQLYSDARFLLNRLSEEIRNSTVDYEEYFNRMVMEGAYGQNYGLYRRQFYHPGSDGLYGSLCNNGAVWTPGVSCVIEKESRDQNTGQNPYNGHPSLEGLFSEDAEETIFRGNAFCGFVNDAGVASSSENPSECNDETSPSLPGFEQEELFLISADGFEKTLFFREALTDPDGDSPSYALSMVKMDGVDTNADNTANAFECTEDFDCTDTSGAYEIPGGQDSSYDASETSGLLDFVPISSNRLNVVDATFMVSPLESPFYIFAEGDPETQTLPFITILLTVEPNEAITGVTPGEFRMTLQETVSTQLLTSPPAPIYGQYADR